MVISKGLNGDIRILYSILRGKTLYSANISATLKGTSLEVLYRGALHHEG